MKHTEFLTSKERSALIRLLESESSKDNIYYAAVVMLGAKVADKCLDEEKQIALSAFGNDPDCMELLFPNPAILCALGYYYGYFDGSLATAKEAVDFVNDNFTPNEREKARLRSLSKT